MKSKSTILWFLIAATLAAAIWFVDFFFKPAVPGEKLLLAGLRADKITGIQVIPGGAREISVVHSNQAWMLERPLVYPAQGTAIDGLLQALAKLKPAMTFTPGELNAQKNASAEFGFDNPQYKLDLTGDDESWHLVVGNKTAPGDGVYVQIVGAPGAYVTDTAWLQSLPHDAGEWRDTSLVNVPDNLDWLVITNGTQAMELRRDSTNHLWRMLRPLAARANGKRVDDAIAKLRSARVNHFVSDDPKADLTSYGLEPATLDVWLGSGTNLLTAVHVGKETNGTAGEVYARCEGWKTVVTTAKEPLAPWRGAVNDFRDPNLLELTSPVTEVDVHADENFILRQGASNVWTVAGEKFPVEAAEVNFFISTLAHLQISDFVQDAVTASGLQSYGLGNQSRQVTLRATAGDTNHAIAQILFGAATNSEVYVKRGDEDFVYALPSGVLNFLSAWGDGDRFRDRHIWSFSETNVVQVTLRQNGKVRQLVRAGLNDWNLASGQGIIEPHAIEETVHRLGDLSAEVWFGRKFQDSDIGLTATNLAITVELKSGQKYSVEFGKLLPVSQNETTMLAVVTLDGDRWAFIFPRMLCQIVGESLTIP